MKVCTVLLGVVAACAVAYAQQANHGPVVMALQQPLYDQYDHMRQVAVVQQPRQKRSLLLGALGAGALGAGLLGAGVLGAGAVAGAGLLGAKAGFIGGALASRAFSGRSYGGGYGYGGYGGGYYYEPTPVYYGGYRSYPAYYVDDEWC